ncbi:transglutaminase domain-containing protein [Luteolibacter pohnpeiensis]|uniref:Transglutaminase domain-containing protein n=1 Tax=Luteolibacter pohnpeiensis TaxID=454153 RepID=A0A934VQ13_9BACT|nr:transglutaminase-like domain-containing protein [Luteolibacter pohnpeiensis]MBK1881616.1 transglutaminase domain-containing protein [Luteolibacter pohnpeiensis]
MTGNVIAAVLLAVIVETAHFVRLRWNFDDHGYARSWHLSTIAIIVLLVVFWLDDSHRSLAVSRVMGWLPVLLFPVQFTQSYGLQTSIPLNIFSFFARQRYERNLRHGLQESVIKLNFGNAYLVITLVASTLGEQANPYFYLPGIVLLIGWPMVRNRRKRPAGVLFALFIATLFALTGQATLHFATSKYSYRGKDSGSGTGLDAKTSHTQIGKLGDIKVSRDILWRLKIRKGDPFPSLLRAASYNRYINGTWDTRLPPGSRSLVLDFQDLSAYGTSDSEDYYLIRANADGKEATLPTLPRFSIRGSVNNKSLLPMPGNAASIKDFELDGIERNSFGTIRIYPQNPIIDGTILWGDHQSPEVPPWPQQDLAVIRSESRTVAEVVESLGLKSAPTLDEKLNIVKRWFDQNFTYTRYLSIPAFYDASANPTTAISQFLTTDRKGHCEYFATAATLLLREAGVPTRYTIGFAVRETDPKDGTAVIRGEHCHAWCRVWDEKNGIWKDFDPTPGNWFALEEQRLGKSSFQWLADGLLIAREDFFLWRNRPKNQLIISIIVTILAVGALIVIIRRLAKSRHVVHEHQSAESVFESNIRTALNELEPTAKKILGPRPPGQSLPQWLLPLQGLIAAPELVAEAITLHQKLRFDPAPSSKSVKDRLQSLADQIREQLDRLADAKA